MKLSVAYQGGTRYDIVTDRHRVVTDQLVDEGGTDAGMSPVELFVGSVASCVGYFVGLFCARHDIFSEVKGGGVVASHGGSLLNFHSVLKILPEHRLGVVVAANSAGAQGAVNRIATEALKLLLEAKTGI